MNTCPHCESMDVKALIYTVRDDEDGRQALRSCEGMPWIPKPLPALPPTFELMKCNSCGKRSVRVIK
jgi:hypothetical protein